MVMPSSSTNNAFLEVNDVYKSFQLDSQTVNVLNGINLTLQRGEMLTMIGASGAGKSTFLHILGTLNQPTQGTILYERQDVFRLSENDLANFRNRRIGFIFQFHHLLPEFTALENTSLPALIQKRSKQEMMEEAVSLLDDVGLGHRLHHKPGELSGGEQQRVAVARALIQNPDLVLADEPTGNLDARTGETIFELLQTLNQKRGTAFIIVTHIERLYKQAERLIRMVDGKIENGEGA